MIWHSLWVGGGLKWNTSVFQDNRLRWAGGVVGGRTGVQCNPGALEGYQQLRDALLGAWERSPRLYSEPDYWHLSPSSLTTNHKGFVIYFFSLVVATRHQAQTAHQAPSLTPFIPATTVFDILLVTKHRLHTRQQDSLLTSQQAHCLIFSLSPSTDSFTRHWLLPLLASQEI